MMARALLSAAWCSRRPGWPEVSRLGRTLTRPSGPLGVPLGGRALACLSPVADGGSDLAGPVGGHRGPVATALVAVSPGSVLRQVDDHVAAARVVADAQPAELVRPDD